MHVDNWEMWSAFAAWTAIFLTIIIKLHNARIAEIKNLSEHIDAIRTEVKAETKDAWDSAKQERDNTRAEAKRDHEELRIQMQGLSNTVRDHYLLRREFNQIIKGLDANMIEIRKDVGSLSNRINDLLRDIYRKT